MTMSGIGMSRYVPALLLLQPALLIMQSLSATPCSKSVQEQGLQTLMCYGADDAKDLKRIACLSGAPC